jgi:hypothetical protein
VVEVQLIDNFPPLVVAVFVPQEPQDEARVTFAYTIVPNIKGKSAISVI